MIIKDYVRERKNVLKDEISSFERTPKLVIIQVNDDPASCAYVKGKLKDAAEIGINAELLKFPVTITQEELLKEIDKVNNDESVDGLIVQMPLPKGIDEELIKLSVNPTKDVDGFHPLSSFVPCTPKGIIDYLKASEVSFVGKNAVVIGRSNIVGKPVAKLLLQEHCNVTVLHSRTKEEDMNFYIAHADIIVIAIGKMHFLDKQTFKKSAVVVDVGISRDENGLHGDARPGLDVALQTPVPGGVGLLTRLSLMSNLVLAYKNKIGK